MKFAHLLSVAVALAGLNISFLVAGEVRIEGVHMCCDQCVNIAQSKLKAIAGVTGGKADKDAGSITLTAADEKAAGAAIDALAKAGFRGKAKHGDKTLEFPPSNADKGAKADAIAITGVHLCCPACYRAAEKALKGVDGVTAVNSDKKTKTLEVSGKGVDVNAAIQSLFDAGFQAAVKK